MDTPENKPEDTSLPQVNDLKCSKGGGPREGLHSCPYQEAVCANDDGEYCDCCDKCTDECSWDV